MTDPFCLSSTTAIGMPRDEGRERTRRRSEPWTYSIMYKEEERKEMRERMVMVSMMRVQMNGRAVAAPLTLFHVMQSTPSQ